MTSERRSTVPLPWEERPQPRLDELPLPGPEAAAEFPPQDDPKQEPTHAPEPYLRRG